MSLRSERQLPIDLIVVIIFLHIETDSLLLVKLIHFVFAEGLFLLLGFLVEAEAGGDGLEATLAVVVDFEHLGVEVGERHPGVEELLHEAGQLGVGVSLAGEHPVEVRRDWPKE